MPYDIEEHKHRFAAWAAGRAASVKGCRFTVEQAKAIIEAVGLRRCIEDPGTLPAPAAVDGQHWLWRQSVIEEASRLGLTFTHGVAAKLINIYLKASLVCGGNHQHERIGCLHPPIDKVLLDELKRQNVGGLRKQWGAFSKTGWSNFDSGTYEEVIRSIRASIPHSPLWEIEGHWQGHQ